MPYSCKNGVVVVDGSKAMFISFVKQKSPFDSMSHSGSTLQDACFMFDSD